MNRHAAHAYKAVEMIDLLTGYFDGGKRWICVEMWPAGWLVSFRQKLPTEPAARYSPTRAFELATLSRHLPLL